MSPSKVVEEGITETDDLMSTRLIVEGKIATLDANALKTAEQKTAAIKKQMSPPGEFFKKQFGENPPPLLDKRRCSYGIIDDAWKFQPAFGRIFVYQRSQLERETYVEGGTIIMPGKAKEREAKTAPTGIIVNGGAEALGILRANGMDLGHHVAFIRMAPFQMVIGNVDGEDHKLLIFRAGDIVGSKDLADSLRAGDMSIEWDADQYEYYYKDTKTGEMFEPSKAEKPFLGDDH